MSYKSYDGGGLYMSFFFIKFFILGECFRENDLVCLFYVFIVKVIVEVEVWFL